MAYGRHRHISTYALPSLYASLIVSVFAGIAFTSDLYIGALYPPDLADVLGAFITSPLFAIPAALFGLVAIWPVATISAEATALLIRRTALHRDWSIWLLSGALIGAPMLLLYSFPLRLGQTMIGPLFANGALFGMACAAIVRKFAGPQIDEPAIGLEPESTDNTV